MATGFGRARMARANSIAQGSLYMTTRPLLTMLLAALALLGATHLHARPSATIDQYLDRTPDPSWRLDGRYIASADYETYGSSDSFELDGRWAMGYFRDLLYGDMELDLVAKLQVFGSTASINLPNQLLDLYIDLDWTWRYVNDTAVRLRLQPGTYSDIEQIDASNLRMPIIIEGVKRFNPTTTAVLGASARAGYDVPFMPSLGVVWQPTPQYRLEALLPKACMLYHLNDRFTVQGDFEWRNTSYNLRESGFTRSEITQNDLRIGAGALYSLSDDLHLTADIGYIFNRSIKFDKTPAYIENEIDVDPATYVTLGFRGPF
jgi:hypothetical protein